MKKNLFLLVGLALAFLAGPARAGSSAGVPPWVYTGTPTNGQAWVYNSATGLWTNGSVSGVGTVTSIAPTDATLTFSVNPIVASGTIGLNLGNANTWTAAQTFPASGIILLGSSTGRTTFASANASASNYTATFPAATITVAGINLAQTWTATQTFGASGIQLLGSSTGYTTFASANAGASNYTITVPAITDTLVALTATQTLTNKTLTSPSMTTPTISSGAITISAFSTAGIVTNNSSGVLASLSNASSVSATLVGILGSGTPSSTTVLYGDGTWKTVSAGVTTTGSPLNTYLTYFTAAGTISGDAGLVVASDVLTNTQALAANTVGDGIVLANTTAATSANQRYSPSLHLTGQGWKTTATAASQTVDWIAEARPVQGAANPTATLSFSWQVNAGGYKQQVVFQNDTTAAQQQGIYLYDNGAYNNGRYTFIGRYQDHALITSSSGVVNINTNGATLQVGNNAHEINFTGDTLLSFDDAATTIATFNQRLTKIFLTGSGGLNLATGTTSGGGATITAIGTNTSESLVLTPLGNGGTGQTFTNAKTLFVANNYNSMISFQTGAGGWELGCASTTGAGYPLATTNTVTAYYMYIASSSGSGRGTIIGETGGSSIAEFAGSSNSYATWLRGPLTAASITTGAPNGGTAGAWKTGIAVTTTALTPSTTTYIQLDVGGTLYKMATYN